MVLVSKNGIPLTTISKESGKNESFSALTATIFGASDVVFTSFDKSSPTMIEVDSNDDILFIKGVGKSTVFAVIGPSSKKSSLKAIMDGVTKDIENSSSFKGK
ncbi:MAG: roadblock/LC7 domain-containing protein [Thermoplasmata archaeon]